MFWINFNTVIREPVMLLAIDKTECFHQSIITHTVEDLKMVVNV